jgi:hypothetical protein
VLVNEKKIDASGMSSNRVATVPKLQSKVSQVTMRKAKRIKAEGFGNIASGINEKWLARL